MLQVYVFNIYKGLLYVKLHSYIQRDVQFDNIRKPVVNLSVYKQVYVTYLIYNLRAIIETIIVVYSFFKYIRSEKSLH